MLRVIALTLVAATTVGAASASTDLRSPNETAIAEVASGERTEANAAWWGFNTEDVTESLQAAIDSGAAKVIVPFMGAPWIIRPIMLRGDLELVFEPGVLILAKKNEFKGKGDSLFKANNANNITVRGYGATLRMHKRDYLTDAYEKAEWRMGLSFNGCNNVLIEGVRIESTGGDGIYIGTAAQPYCKDVTIRDVVCFDNHRQGISVIGAENLLIENSVFSNTWGTAPSAGIDLEPDSPNQRLVNCVIRNSLFENNAGHAILVYLKNLDSDSPPVSVRFENCVARMGYGAGQRPEDFIDPEMEGWAGMSVGAAKDNGPKGLVEFINCVSENTGKEGAKVFDVAVDTVKVRFENCSWKNPWLGSYREYPWVRVPVLIELRRPELASSAGNVEFVNCHVYDFVARPVLYFMQPNACEYPLQNVQGDITLHAPEGWDARAQLGQNTANVDLAIHSSPLDTPVEEDLPDADAE